MSINFRQSPTLGYTSYPDFSGDGAITFTFNTGASAAQVAADASLFNNWPSLVTAATTRSGPVTVYFMSNCTVTPDPAGNPWVFPLGSRFIGVASVFPNFTIDGGNDLQGVQLFSDMQITSNQNAQPPTLSGDNPSFTRFDNIDFSVTNGAIWSSGSPGALLILDGCQDANGDPVGANNNTFAFTAAQNFALELYSGTRVGQNCLFTPAVAGTLEVLVVPGCTMSGHQANVDAAWSGINFTAGPSQVPGSGDIASDGGNLSVIVIAGAPFTWPTPEASGIQLATSILLVDSNNAGNAAVTLGRIIGGVGCAFAQGQVLQVIASQTAGAGTDQITILQPNGAAIPGAPILRGIGATAGQARGVTLRCFRPDDPPNCWSVIDTFVVPA